MTARRLALLALLAPLAGPALAQQELYALGRFNKIWRIDGYDTATPSLTHVTTWSFEGLEPVGLERDPLSGEFLLLLSPWSKFNGDDSKLVRVDPLTGQTTLVCTFPITDLRGLERSWNGTLYSIRGVGA